MRCVQFKQIDFDVIVSLVSIMIVASFLSCCASKKYGEIHDLHNFHRKMDFEVDLGNRRIEKVKECLA